MEPALSSTMHIFILLFGLLVTVIAVPSALATDAIKVQITPKDCARVVDHVPASDVEYKAGVDVRGRTVAPADLAGSTLKVPLPDVLEFDIAFNPLSGAAATKFGETSLSVGKIRYDINRRKITFNGQPIGGDDLAVLAERCRDILKTGK